MTTPATDLLIIIESPACPTNIVGIMSLYEITIESTTAATTTTTTTLYYSAEESSHFQVYNLVNETNFVHNILSIRVFRQFYL